MRLALGFGSILALMALLLAGSAWSSRHTRRDSLETLQAAQQRTALANRMRSELLQEAVAVRNMGLATEIDTVNRQAQSARAHSAAFAKAQAELAPLLNHADEQAALARLVELDRKIAPMFKDAVDVSLAFNTEVAAKIIGTQIDPLSDRIIGELDQLERLQAGSAATAVEQAESSARRSDRLVLVAGVGMLVLTAGLGLALTRSITRPLKLAEEATGRVAHGDLASAIVVDGRDEPARLLAAISHMRDRLAVIVSGVRQGTDGIDHAAAEIATGNADLSARTETQASALQQTSATMQQLADTVKHNASLSSDAQALAQRATQTAAAGQAAVNGVIETMSAIESSSKRIVEINAVIDGIAFQTNILALNAAVEAARAGEHGRGFAVVASEVRALAHRTSGAAKEINGLISAAAERARDGTQIVHSAGQTMGAIMAEVQRVNAIITQISGSSREQAGSLDEVTRAVSDIDNATQQNAALVEQAAAAAQSMLEQSGRLTQAVSAFRV
ncbi:MAG: HAMP domain-containing protein [Burkholderiales bacterium]|nr:HAMP domain-containing protein [Burkholderiales bacterium]